MVILNPDTIRARATGAVATFNAPRVMQALARVRDVHAR
jgi:hypothetical protein